MNKIKFIAILTILLLSAATASFAQNTNWQASPKTVKRINDYLERLDKIGYNGAVLVAFDGKPVISKGYGFSDFEGRIKNSPNTIFDTGSLTKQFTAAAILKLEMQGKLSTDDKITKYFRNVPPDKAGITIHQLLRHSAGFRGGIGGDFDRIPEAEFIEKVFASELRFPAGTRYSYSNIGYSLLALIVEKVSGQTYEQYLYENLWKPAGMETTGYTRPDFDKKLIAAGYRNDERWGKPTEKLWDKDAPFLHLKGNGGVLSTTLDLFRWDQALTSDKILSKAAKEKYFSPALRADENKDAFYAYGWHITKTERNTRRVWHNGTNRIFYAEFYRYPDDRVTIILMTNKSLNSDNDTGRILSEIIFDANYKPVIPIPNNAANRALTDESIRLALEKGAAAAIENYRRRNKKTELLENVLYAKGIDLIESDKPKEAVEIFKLSTYAFPNSSLAFEGLGEAYLAAGDKKSALENYRKSLRLDPRNGNSRDAVKKLEEQ